MSLPNRPELSSNEDSQSEPTKIITLGKTTIFNNPVDANLAAALGYLPVFPLGLIMAFILLNSPSESHNFNRFHASQSIILGGVFFLAMVVSGGLGSFLTAIPVLNFVTIPIFWLIGALLPMVYAFFALKCAWSAFQGKTYKLPYISPVAESIFK